MEVKQIYELVNAATQETLGSSAVLNEDLSNLVDIGQSIENARGIENYTRSLVDHIGKVIFVNRPYSGSVPSVLRDGWEYGSILEKITAQLPEATENETWELEDGASYDPNIFYKPSVSAKFFNSKTTWEIPMSFAERQAKSSFSNAGQMNGFLSMLYTAVENSATIKTSELIMRTINHFIGETFYNLSSEGTYTGAGNMRCVNLLYAFNQRYNSGAGDTPLTAAQAVTDPDFIRFAGYVMSLYKNRLTRMSTLFNIGGQPRFTPTDRLHIVMLSEFAQAAGVFLQSDTFHDTFVKLPEAEIVPYWQGSGTGYAFTSTAAIDIKTKSSGATSVQPTGILAVMFDREALGVCNEDRRVTTNYNPKAEFFSNWYKFDTSYFNDFNENFVVFYVKDES